jgi:hypothetical protein
MLVSIHQATWQHVEPSGEEIRMKTEGLHFTLIPVIDGLSERAPKCQSSWVYVSKHGQTI